VGRETGACWAHDLAYCTRRTNGAVSQLPADGAGRSNAWWSRRRAERPENGAIRTGTHQWRDRRQQSRIIETLRSHWWRGRHGGHCRNASRKSPRHRINWAEHGSRKTARHQRRRHGARDRHHWQSGRYWRSWRTWQTRLAKRQFVVPGRHGH
jgi:hypothetical protein